MSEFVLELLDLIETQAFDDDDLATSPELVSLNKAEDMLVYLALIGEKLGLEITADDEDIFHPSDRLIKL